MILNPKTHQNVPAWSVLLLALLGFAVLPGFTMGSLPDDETAQDVAASRPVEHPATTRESPTPQDDEKKKFSIQSVTASKRAFGPEQATGAPDTMGSGRKRTAWAPRTPNGGVDWLQLTFQQAVDPEAVRIYENHNPGAVFKVAFLDRKGKPVVTLPAPDPTSPKRNRGIRVIQVGSLVNQRIRCLKIYLDTRRVPGWNEIDAVEVGWEFGAGSGQGGGHGVERDHRFLISFARGHGALPL